jgi:hypothetical protein
LRRQTFGFPTVTKWDYIDKEGKYITNAQFDDVRDFSDSLAAVTTRGQVGFIDKKGIYIINPQFNRLGGTREGFFNELALVIVGEKFGYIDKKGKYIWNLTN